MKYLREIIERVEKDVLSALYPFKMVLELSRDGSSGHYLDVRFFVRNDMPLAHDQGEKGRQYRKKLFGEATERFRLLIDDAAEELETILETETEGALHEDYVPLLIRSITGFVTEVDLLLRERFDEAICPEGIGSGHQGNHLVFHLGFLVQEKHIDLLETELSKMHTSKWNENDFTRRKSIIWTANHRLKRLFP